MDDTDSKIIDVLLKNSRMSFRKIAKETGLSTDTVMRRYQKLEKEGVIQPTIKVNLEKLGYEAQVFFAVKVASQSSLKEIIEKASEIPDLTNIIKVNGEYDLWLVAVARNIKHVFKIGDEISKIPGIIKVILLYQDTFSYPDANIFPPTGYHNLHLRTP
jgi:DNA-binding Lrp family transcriptional regulator